MHTSLCCKIMSLDYPHRYPSISMIESETFWIRLFNMASNVTVWTLKIQLSFLSMPANLHRSLYIFIILLVLLLVLFTVLLLLFPCGTYYMQRVNFPICESFISIWSIKLLQALLSRGGTSSYLFCEVLKQEEYRRYWKMWRRWWARSRRR